MDIIRKDKQAVCNANCLQVERLYEAYLGTKNLEHSDAVFDQFLREYGKNICLEHGESIYVDGKVQCSKHNRDEVVDEDVLFWIEW